MSWILFSILAALTWAIVDIVDKFTVSKWTKKPAVPVIILGLVSLIIGFLTYVFRGFPPLSQLNISLAFVAGIFYVLVSFFYFKSVKIEEISRVVPLLYITPLFVAPLAAIFLGEMFTLIKYLGIALILIGAILITSKTFFKISLGKAFWLMVLASLAMSLNVIITKYLLNFADFWTIFSYIRMGAIFALIPIFYFNFSDFISTIKQSGGKIMTIVSLNQSLNFLGVLFITIAMSIGYATLVDTLSSIQPFFVLIFVIFLTYFFPKIIKEEITKTSILFKLIAITLMFVGVFLIT